jgi:hypothetical protein
MAASEPSGHTRAPESRPSARANAREDPPCVEVTPGEARYLLGIFDLVRDGVKLGLVQAGGLDLTSAGTSAALGLGHRRQAARVLALDVLGLDEAQANTEAGRLAPAVSSTLAQRLMRLKGTRR